MRAGNHTYLDVAFAGLDGYSATRLLFQQKLAARTPLSAAWTSRDGRAWLVVNEQPDSANYDSASPTLRMTSVPGLPGYVATSPYGDGWYIDDATRSDEVAQLFLQIPGTCGRDQEDLFVVPRAGEEWARWGAGRVIGERAGLAREGPAVDLCSRSRSCCRSPSPRREPLCLGAQVSRARPASS